MARSPLFSSLRRLSRRAQQSTSIDESRRRFVTQSMRTAGALSATGLLAACAGGGSARRGLDPYSARIAIVGGGLAGIHAAWQLAQAGVYATVYEASGRLGGRTFTSRPTFPGGQFCELGGELIDSNHATMWTLADTLGLTLDDRFANEPEGLRRDLWWVDGAEVPEHLIVEQFQAVVEAFAKTTALADASPEGFAQIDAISIQEWLDTHVPKSGYHELHTLLVRAYEGEFGLPADQQSVLNLLYLIDFQTPDPFRVFGDSDERFHTHEGNDAFVKRMAADLDPSRLVLDHRLTEIHDAPAGAYRLVFEQPSNGPVEVEADHVILALPFTQLRKVLIDVADFSDAKREVINHLGYGTNTKVMASFDTRIWRETYLSNGSVTCDLPMQQTWDTSIGQAGRNGLITNFLGADQSLAAGEMGDAEAWFETVVLPDMEQIFPGAAAAYVPGSAVMMHWPGVRYMEGSYTCYRPGQWKYWGTEGVRQGNIHFCGEHCSADFQGWMEGAAETGGIVAAEVLDDLGLGPSAEHEKQLAFQLVGGHPCYHGGGQIVRSRHRLQTIKALRVARLAAREAIINRSAETVTA